MKRYELLHFVDTSMNSNTPAYELIGEGVATLTENFNGESETKQWIHERNGTTQVKAYTPSIEISREDCTSDNMRTWFKQMINTLPTGEDAVTSYVRVDISGEATSGAYAAYKQGCAVTVGSTGGDAGENVTDVITLGGVGDPVAGTFNPTTKEFTPNP